MRRTMHVRVFRGERKYVAECMHLPVVTQADILDELAPNIQEAIGLPSRTRGIHRTRIGTHPTIMVLMELPAVA